MTDIRERAVSFRQLELDFGLPAVASTPPPEVVIEAPSDPEPDADVSVYEMLCEVRDTAYGRHRSGVKAIVNLALDALLNGSLSPDDYMRLFGSDERVSDLTDETPAAPAPIPIPTPTPQARRREGLDWRSLAAGEGVCRPGDDEEDDDDLGVSFGSGASLTVTTGPSTIPR